MLMTICVWLTSHVDKIYLCYKIHMMIHNSSKLSSSTLYEVHGNYFSCYIIVFLLQHFVQIFWMFCLYQDELWITLNICHYNTNERFMKYLLLERSCMSFSSSSINKMSCLFHTPIFIFYLLLLWSLNLVWYWSMRVLPYIQIDNIRH